MCSYCWKSLPCWQKITWIVPQGIKVHKTGRHPSCQGRGFWRLKKNYPSQRQPCFLELKRSWEAWANLCRESPDLNKDKCFSQRLYLFRNILGSQQNGEEATDVHIFPSLMSRASHVPIIVEPLWQSVAPQWLPCRLPGSPEYLLLGVLRLWSVCDSLKPPLDEQAPCLKNLWWPGHRVALG